MNLKTMSKTYKTTVLVKLTLTATSYKLAVAGLFFNKYSMEKVLFELKKLFKENQIPIRPNRSFERNSGKYRRRIKPKITKNQKDSL